jgi:hypothetical protein
MQVPSGCQVGPWLTPIRLSRQPIWPRKRQNVHCEAIANGLETAEQGPVAILATQWPVADIPKLSGLSCISGHFSPSLWV